MIEVLNREKFDIVLEQRDSKFYESSCYAIACGMINNEYEFYGIKENDVIIDCFSVIKNKINFKKMYKFTITSDISKYELSKILYKNFKKNKCLFYSIVNDINSNIYKKYYSIKLNGNTLDSIDLSVRSNINNAYKHPLEIIDISLKNIDVMNILFKNKLNKQLILNFINDDNFKFKVVTLNIPEYNDSLLKQRNELLLRKVENKMNYQENDNIIDERLNYIDNIIESLKKIKEKKGSVLYLSAGIFFKYKDKFVEFKVMSDKDLVELNSEYFLTFKMMKYALDENYKEYISLNNSNIFNLNLNEIYKCDDIPIKKFKFKLYDRREKKRA